MKMLRDLFRKLGSGNGTRQEEDAIDTALLREEQRAELEHNLTVLDKQEEAVERRVQREAEQQARSAAADSLRSLHLIQGGNCPVCNAVLKQYAFASICESCGWNTYDVPERGPVRIHLRDADDEIVEGERCSVLKDGTALVLKGQMVTARVPARFVGWIEYVWPEKEVVRRRREVVSHMTIMCGWCGADADPDHEGFHLVHIAFGATQERYCFCSDRCYEAFRNTYPSRVDRNCYERNCDTCNSCIKRYGSEGDGRLLIAKDYLDRRHRLFGYSDNGKAQD
ncbi:MAG: hypothetical protein JXR37_17280 [Kiritimatiellae bacterium]|nr:hypothetical protein [Kiritimatiellia bacterium]